MFLWVHINTKKFLHEFRLSETAWRATPFSEFTWLCENFEIFILTFYSNVIHVYRGIFVRGIHSRQQFLAQTISFAIIDQLRQLRTQKSKNLRNLLELLTNDIIHVYRGIWARGVHSWQLFLAQTVSCVIIDQLRQLGAQLKSYNFTTILKQRYYTCFYRVFGHGEFIPGTCFCIGFWHRHLVVP